MNNSRYSRVCQETSLTFREYYSVLGLPTVQKRSLGGGCSPEVACQYQRFDEGLKMVKFSKELNAGGYCR